MNMEEIEWILNTLHAECNPKAREEDINRVLSYIANLQEKYEEADNDRHKLLEQKEKAIEKIKSIRIFGLRSGRTLIATLLNEVVDTLQGDDSFEKENG